MTKETWNDILTLMRVWNAGVFFLILLAGTGCMPEKQADMKDFYKVYGSDLGDMGSALKELSELNLYFGHQSVGFDILSGLELWEKETGVSIRKAETRDFSNTGEASLVHFQVGANKDPFSKIDDFAALVHEIPKDEPAIAFFKFCYIDFHKTADVDAIFQTYKEKMLDLRDSVENCRIVLFTVPVTTLQKGPKALVKKILGKPLNHSLENIKRNAFSDRIRTELGDEFPVFDLARVESTLPDGSTETFKMKGQAYPRLPESYTRDQGHLNPEGAKLVAYNLIAFLTEEF